MMNTKELQRLVRRRRLTPSCEVEFLRFSPKIRTIGDFSEMEAAKIVLDKIRFQVIRNAKDLRALGHVFLKAHANEAAILDFLSDPDMRVDELYERTAGARLAHEVNDLLMWRSNRFHSCGVRIFDMAA